MQPIYERSNFDGLMDEWCDYASQDKKDPNAKTQLYEKTEQAASTIEGLIAAGNTKEATHLAKTILKTFTSEQGFKHLPNWIAKNSMQSGGYVGGAFKSFHNLTNAVQRAINPFQDQKTLSTIAMLDSWANDLLKSTSEKLPDFEAVVNEWLKYAEKSETGTTAKMKLYKKTDEFVKLLKGSDKEKAKFYAEVISNTFAAHEGASRYLTQWITENTLKSGEYIEGAAKSFHFLAEAVQLTVNPPESQKWIFTTIGQIDFLATNLLKGKDFSNDEYEHGHDDQIVPDDVLNLIVHNAVQNNSVEDSAGLREVTKLQQKAANAYQGPLKMLGIQNEEEAIAYATKFGKELTFINIIGVQFTSRDKFQEFIGKLPNLTTLHMNDYDPMLYLDTEDLAVIRDNCPNLINLQIPGSYIEYDVVEFIAKNFPDLQVLNLSGNPINEGGGGLNAIAQHLKKLVTLSLSGCKIHDEAVMFSAEDFPRLQTLDLSKNKITSDGAIAITGSLKELVTLNLSECQIRNRFSEEEEEFHESAIVMGKNIQTHLKKLETLDLSYNRPTDEELQGIVESFENHPIPVTLLFGNQWLNNKYAKAIAEGFKKGPNIGNIDLSENEIGNSGIKAIAENLKFLPNIHEIDLSYNSFADKGLIAIAENLKFLPNIQKINLRNNYFEEDEGIKILIKELKEIQRTSVLTLDLSRCLSNKGRSAIEALNNTHPNIHVIF